MRKKLSQLNIHVPWLQGNPPRNYIGCWVGPCFVHKCSENGMINGGCQEFLIYIYKYIYISDQVNQFDQMHIVYTSMLAI